jgi:hypothetical protein
MMILSNDSNTRVLQQIFFGQNVDHDSLDEGIITVGDLIHILSIRK